MRPAFPIQIDLPGSEARNLDARSIWGVECADFVRHLISSMPMVFSYNPMVLELQAAPAFVNMGLNFGRVEWRALSPTARSEIASGCITVWRGEIVAE